ncbi:hypothetical protein RSK20926_09884 [Roseobacter sp. SK209-2-6]|nr:hypothetical protein RSK20926_09884 [Roseobacter sp. SK209-2-6]
MFDLFCETQKKPGAWQHPALARFQMITPAHRR